MSFGFGEFCLGGRRLFYALGVGVFTLGCFSGVGSSGLDPGKHLKTQQGISFMYRAGKA